jgi:hypothetical protein
VRIVEGRMFRPGTSAIVVGSSTASGFAGSDIGASLRFAGRDWLIVGRYDSGRSGFDSEIWGDAEQMAQAFRRLTFSIAVFRLADAGLQPARLEAQGPGQALLEITAINGRLLIGWATALEQNDGLVIEQLEATRNPDQSVRARLLVRSAQ